MKLLIAASVALAMNLAYAEKPLNQPPKTKAQKKVDSGFLSSGFIGNNETKSLGPNFKGHNCTAITNALEKINLKKDEFESSDAYAARTEAALKGTVYGQVSFEDNLALVVDVNPIDIKYDADSQTLSMNRIILHRTMEKHGSTGGLTPGEVVQKLSNENSEYIGTNGFGARVVVTKYSGSVCAVGLKISKNRKSSGLSELTFESHVPPDIARASKDKISIAYVGKIAPPYAGTYAFFTDPSRDRPVEFAISGDAVYIAPEYILVFNRSTGEVFGDATLTTKF